VRVGGGSIIAENPIPNRRKRRKEKKRRRRFSVIRSLLLLRLLLLSIQLRRDEWKGPGLLGGQGTTAQPLYSVRVCAGGCVLGCIYYYMLRLNLPSRSL
jgi:hypothetical protein